MVDFRPRTTSNNHEEPHPASSAGRRAREGWFKMDVLPDRRSSERDENGRKDEKDGARIEAEPVASQETPRATVNEASEDLDGQQSRATSFRVYKRRWFGLVQLALLNIIVSWDWLTFAAVSRKSADYFNVSETAINWLSTAFFFAYVAVSPVVIWILNRGPKPSIIIASILTLAGNWVRYAGSRATGGHFGVVMFGQILIGFAQPFVLAAPTRYSDLWFTDRGRVSATAVASLANPLGGALGQLIGPMWVNKPSDVPNMVLYTSIISSIASLPSFFIPAKPPIPPSASSSIPKIVLKESLHRLSQNPSFYLLFIPFSVYVGCFNAISSLLNQIMEPYGYSEDQAGICGAVLILVGLLSSAITSPIIDRNHAYLLSIKLLVPFIAASYLTFLFTPSTHTLTAPYITAAILGASSFSLVPIALEYLVEVTWPASPEVGSTLCWGGGQLLGAIFIIIAAPLKGASGEPDGSLRRFLIFLAVVGWAVVPLPLMLGIKRFGLDAKAGRLGVDEGVETESAEERRRESVRAMERARDMEGAIRG